MELCVFSKHFQALDYQNLGRTLKNLGFEGVDLTVRKGGHVEPEQVKEKLLQAKEILSKEGIKITMITTEIIDINQPFAKDVLETAAAIGIGYFKLGYYIHNEFGNLKKSLEESRNKLSDINNFCKGKKIKGGYHNHSGDCLGASVPHVLKMLEKCDPKVMGVYYDIGHAHIEGGYSGWKMNLDEISDRLFMVAVKDLNFIKKENTDVNKWSYQIGVVPIGEGLVHWAEFFTYLKKISFSGPMSIHSEYNFPVEQVIEQTRKDLEFLKKFF